MAEMIPDQHGDIRLVTISNPAAGAEIVITQDARVRWEIKSLMYTFVTDGTVANRESEVIFTVGAVEWLRLMPRGKQLASLTDIYSWYPGSKGVKGDAATVQGHILPGNLRFNNQVVISTDTVAMAAGDQYSNVRMIVEEWIEPLA